MRTALIFRERLLAPSETFIPEQARFLQRYRPVLVGLRRTADPLQHELDEILFRDGDGTVDKLAVNLYRRFPHTPKFIDRLRALAPSIIHAHFAIDAMQALPIAKQLGIPLVVSLHGFDVTSSDETLRSSFAGSHYVRHKPDLFREASAFVCVSQFIRQAALRAGFPESKLAVHYTGIDCARFRPTTTERDRNLILFVGRLVEKKGCEFLLRALSLVLQSHPGARVEVIGDGPLRTSLEELSRSLALPVTFRGAQSPQEVLRRMSHAGILCNPSVTAASGDMEGFGMVFAEAQAVGTPVVSFAHAAIPEAVSHGRTGLLCPEKNIVALSHCMRLLLENDGMWQSMHETGPTWVREHFHIARQAEKLESIYDRCIVDAEKRRDQSNAAHAASNLRRESTRA